jgi:hypothetical protein
MQLFFLANRESKENKLHLMFIKLKSNVPESPQSFCHFDIQINVNEWNDSSKREHELDQNIRDMNKLVLVLEICVRHIPQYNSNMSIIDAGILCGYKANQDDLQEILNIPNSLVSNYKISDGNVVFYLDTLPFGKPYCIQFRIIEEHIISNTQIAMVKVSDYYKSGKLLVKISF